MAPSVLTLRGALERAAAIAPSRGITIFDSRGRNPLRRLYPDVLASASQIARRWRAAGISPGDRLLIARPTSWELVDSWMGALLARAIPAVAPPGGGFGSGRSDIDRIARMAEKLDAKFVQVSESLRQDAIALGLHAFAERAITFEELSGVPPASSIPDVGDPSPIAFLQFTSGTEGFPRALAISDGAAIHNALALNEAALAPLEAQQIDAIVSWLPLHHDMGLVGAFLLSILTGRDLVLLPPQAFLARPRQWLNEIGNYSSALSLSPAFGFAYCAERLTAGQTSDLNLSGWRAAICGAETIHPRTAAEFTSAFASSSFRADAFRAGYGLAEATVAVTLDRKGKGARTRPIPTGNGRGREVQEVVCLGEPVADTEIRCAGPNGIERREDEIGEILVRGPGLFSGYFGDRPATQAAFRQGWLRTGDLGFIHSGELYLTGRSKDVLIIRGENFMPQQLEWMAEGICGGMSRAAAFSVETAQSERAVLLVETTVQDGEQIAETSSEIRSRIGDAFGVQLADLVFLRRGRLPTTRSGKLRRSEARAQYLEGRLQCVGP